MPADTTGIVFYEEAVCYTEPLCCFLLMFYLPVTGICLTEPLYEKAAPG